MHFAQLHAAWNTAVAFLCASGDTQLLNLGTVSFTDAKRRGGSVSIQQTKITFLLEYPVYAINRTMFSRMNGFGLRFWNLMRKRGYSL